MNKWNEAAKQRQREVRYRLIQAGICTQCRTRPAIEDMQSCTTCRDHQRQVYFDRLDRKARLLANEAAGITEPVVHAIDSGSKWWHHVD